MRLVADAWRESQTQECRATRSVAIRRWCLASQHDDDLTRLESRPVSKREPNTRVSHRRGGALRPSITLDGHSSAWKPPVAGQLNR